MNDDRAELDTPQLQQEIEDEEHIETDAEASERVCCERIEKLSLDDLLVLGVITAWLPSRRKSQNVANDDVRDVCGLPLFAVQASRKRLEIAKLVGKMPRVRQARKEEMPEDAVNLVNYWCDLMRKHMRKKPPVSRVRWEDDVRKMHEIDQVAYEDMRRVIDWLYTDSEGANFWRVNILSGDKLRKQFDRLYARMVRDAYEAKKTGFDAEANQRLLTKAEERDRKKKEKEMNRALKEVEEKKQRGEELNRFEQILLNESKGGRRAV